MRHLKVAALALAMLPAIAAAQVAPTIKAAAPANFLPGSASFCSSDSGETWVPCPPSSGGGSGGGGGTGDASASNQATQIARETSIRDQIGAITSPATGSSNYWLSQIQGLLAAPLTVGTHAVTQSGAWSTAVSNFPATQAISATALPLPTGAATAAGQLATTAALPARDTNGDLRVPTVSVTPFYVPVPANTSTEILASSSTRIGYELQCTGNVAVAISRTHATLSSATPSAGGADWIIPAGTTPAYIPAYVSGLGTTAYATAATACWGVNYARQ